MKDEIVVTGVSCRLPNTSNMNELWKHLIEGVDMVDENDLYWPRGKLNLFREKIYRLSLD